MRLFAVAVAVLALGGRNAAAALTAPGLHFHGITCKGSHRAVQCRRDDGKGYGFRITTRAVAVYDYAHGGKRVFVRTQPKPWTAQHSKYPDSPFLLLRYAGVICTGFGWIVSCARETDGDKLPPYGVMISKIELTVTGHIGAKRKVFDRFQPKPWKPL